MAFDVLHEGHIRLLETAKEHGHVVVGLLTDAAISSVKRFLTCRCHNERLSPNSSDSSIQS